MEPEFGESQFEMGLSAELVGSPPGSGLFEPVFRPTQRQEAEFFIDLATRSKLVNDVESGEVRLAPLFIQTKVSEKLTRSWTDQWKKLDEIIGVEEEYYRFDVYLGKHHQHNQLVEIGRNWPLTFYVAPSFIEYEKYWEYRRNEELFWNAAFIQLGKLEHVDQEGHVIAFTYPDPKGCILSEPETIDIRRGEEVFQLEEITDSYRTFDQLRNEMAQLRNTLFYEFGPGREEGKNLERLGSPDDYDSGNVPEWIMLQRQFMRMSADVYLRFIPSISSYAITQPWL